MSVLFFGKKGDAHCKKALEFLKKNFPDTSFVLGKHGEPFPEECHSWTGDYILSYLSHRVIPETLLKQAKKWSINFHPGPPEYPGIGCTNFAIYNNETIYGVTCHHMAVKVDTGDIIKVKRFPIHPKDSVYTLTQRSYDETLKLFYEIMSEAHEGKPLPKSKEVWKRKPYKRSELNALCKIESDMSPEEKRRRVRAVTFPGAPGAYMEIDGIRVEYKDSSGKE